MFGSTKNSSVVDADPGSGAFLTPASGINKSVSGSGCRDHISESLEIFFWLNT
jgi:hypothetical protein